jgi:hypothetical protein
VHHRARRVGRLQLLAVMCAAVGFAAYQNNLAAIYVAAGIYVVLHELRAIAAKLDLLLRRNDLAGR